MDFKQQILEALKAKFQGVNANVLNRIADMLSKTVTKAEEVTTAVAGVTQGMIEVIEGYGDSRATEAAQTAVTRYETQHNLRDGKPVEQQGGGQAGGAAAQVVTQSAGGTEQVPAWAQALIDSNKQLSDRLNTMEANRTTTTRKQKLDEIIGKLPENLRKGYARTPLDGTDEEWNTRIQEVQTEVDGLAADITAKGAVFGRPAVQHGAQSSQNELTEAQQKAIAKRDGVPAKDGQPF